MEKQHIYTKNDDAEFEKKVFFIFHFLSDGSDGETRTLTQLPSPDFESGASTIPPQRLKLSYLNILISINWQIDNLFCII